MKKGTEHTTNKRYKHDTKSLLDFKKSMDKISKNIFINMSIDWKDDIKKCEEELKDLKKSLRVINELIKIDKKYLNN
tara:strand:+ start:96 stop:326 length:231 start_codon:yes stop_codon:yes gene_type:complete